MICRKCHKEMKLVAAGTSKKTGKPYKAFYSCTMECGATSPYEEVIYAEPEPKDDKTGELLIIERLDKIDERLNKMGEWIKENVK